MIKKLLRGVYKPGSLSFDFWPMNHYKKYIARPTYMQGRRMGLPKFICLFAATIPMQVLFNIGDLLLLQITSFLIWVGFFCTLFATLFLYMNITHAKSRFYYFGAIGLNKNARKFHQKATENYHQHLNKLENERKRLETRYGLVKDDNNNTALIVAENIKHKIIEINKHIISMREAKKELDTKIIELDTKQIKHKFFQ